MALALRLAFLLVLASHAARAGEPHFREVSQAWGIDFHHTHGGSGQFYMPEIVGAGVVIFDYDGDGDLDLFFVDSGRLPGFEGEAMGSRLYRNDGPGRFTDVTARSGIAVAGYGMGAVAGDVDGDADLDLYVTAFGPNQLFRNEGDGRFTDVTAAAGVGEPAWSTSASFADVDRDGDLDLYVTNYVDFTLEGNVVCGLERKQLRSYCNPEPYAGLPDRFYRNRGDGTFEDRTREAGFAGATGKGQGVIFGDVDEDGWPDLYVSNDMTPNLLYRNRRDGSFEELAMLSGTALSDRGDNEAGMGVDLGDLDGDGLLELIVTNFDIETNALYAHLGGWLFADRRFASRLAGPSTFLVGFGVAFADLDQDADLDVAIANGHTIHNIELWERGPGFHSKQPNQVLVNDGLGRFDEVGNPGLGEPRMSRGLAVGDLDGDGDLDLAITNTNDVAQVFENVTAGAGGWLQVDLAQAAGNRFGVGARLALRATGKLQKREVRTGSSYLSQNALTAHFGLGGAKSPEALEVFWPNGAKRILHGLPADRRVRIVR